MKYTICPTITAENIEVYRQQIEQVKDFAKNLHIDLMDGQFTPAKSPNLEDVWWPEDSKAYIHMMYHRPMDYLAQLIKLKPHMVIIHNEVEVHHMQFAAELHAHGIEVGLAILQDTPIEWAYQIMHSFDQVLVFSGHLGYHGGVADLTLLDKVTKIKLHHPECEIAWDGGINDQNAKILVENGVNILNIGGFIQGSDDPHAAYVKIRNSLDN